MWAVFQGRTQGRADIRLFLLSYCVHLSDFMSVCLSDSVCLSTRLSGLSCPSVCPIYPSICLSKPVCPNLSVQTCLSDVSCVLSIYDCPFMSMFCLYPFVRSCQSVCLCLSVCSCLSYQLVLSVLLRRLFISSICHSVCVCFICPVVWVFCLSGPVACPSMSSVCAACPSMLSVLSVCLTLFMSYICIFMCPCHVWSVHLSVSSIPSVCQSFCVCLSFGIWVSLCVYHSYSHVIDVLLIKL